ncbi:MAG: DUF2442 domain-containing protein [Desulfatiglans sp.]|jgi:hypothetical protein|nr:DUF2442 domain-containing protein [Desulfatiglans sp.]
MSKYHKIENIKFEGDNLLIKIDGKDRSFPLSEISSVLKDASDEELNSYVISPSGYGIHWPLLDEDISIDGLLGINHHPSVNKKFAQQL